MSTRITLLSRVVALTSIAIAGIGILWLAVPPFNAYAGANAVSNTSAVSGLLGPEAVAVIAVALGFAGIALAVTIGRAPQRGRPAHAWHGAAAGLLTVAIGLTFGSLGTVAIAGYLFGAVAVVIGLVVVGLLVKRSPRIGFILAAALVAIVAASVIAGVRANAAVDFVVEVSAALWQRSGEIGTDAVTLGVTALWATICVLTLRACSASRGFEAWLVRHRRTITVLAAIGPLPYAAARATWLTPWPLFAPSTAELSTIPAVRLTGLVLGSGAVAASILTLGLVLPWGRVFPHWMPVAGGRDVPPAAAIVPGTFAALIISVSAIPLLTSGIAVVDGPFSGVVIDLVLPLWFWGPCLALAVWAYSAWRQQPEPVPSIGRRNDTLRGVVSS